MNWKDLRMGFKPIPEKPATYVQNGYYCEECGNTFKSETKYNKGSKQFLCQGCMEKKERQ